MRKIVCLILVFVFCIFFCNSYVFADEVECEYESSVGNYSIIYDDTDSPRISLILGDYLRLEIEIIRMKI